MLFRSSIAVEVVQEPPSALPRFISEAKKDGGAADVIYSGEANLRTVVEQNVLASYVPRDTDWVAAEFKDKGGCWTEDRPVIVRIGYNTNLVPKDQAPKSFKDLADPKWKGRIGKGECLHAKAEFDNKRDRSQSRGRPSGRLP